MAGEKLPRGGKASYFRRLSEWAPDKIRSRVTEFIESVAYKEEVAALAEPTTTTAVQAHNHDSSYSATDHTHSGLAKSGHTHSWPKYLTDLGDVSLALSKQDGDLLTFKEGTGWVNDYPQFSAEFFALEHPDDDSVLAVFDLSELTETRVIHLVDEDMKLLSESDHGELTGGHETALHTHSHHLLNDVGAYDHNHIDDHIDDATIHFTLGSIDHGSIAGLGDDDHVQYVLRSDWLQNGFPTPSDVSISWVSPHMELVVEPSGVSFDYFLSGVRYTETGALTAEITDTEGMWVFYFDAEGSIAAVHEPSHAQVDSVIENYCIIAWVYWDATNKDGRLMDERHRLMDPITHHLLHDVLHAQYEDGMTIDDILTDQSGALDSHAQFGLTEGEFYDEDIKHEPDAVASTVGLEIWYLDGSDWRWTTNAGFSVLTTGTGRLAYNNAGAQAEVGNGSFVLCHVFATNIVEDDGTSPRYIAIQGQAQYGTIALAREGATTEIGALTYGSFPVKEVIPVATIIFQTNNGYANAVKGRTRTTDTGDDWVDWREAGPIAGGGSATEHGTLTGLSDDDHSQYLLASLATDRTTFGANWTDLTDAGETTLHIHDSRYYTESEIDDMLVYYALDGHTHTEADITDLDHFELADMWFGAAVDDAIVLATLSGQIKSSGTELSDLISGVSAHDSGVAEFLPDSFTPGAPTTLMLYIYNTVAQWNADSLQGDAIYASIAPTDGQVLTWDDGNSRWDAADPAGSTDADAIHDNVAGEIAALTSVTAASGDIVLIEDASDSNNKKRVTAGSIAALTTTATDTNAIHDNVSGEISAITSKATPTTSDYLLIEDAAASNAKKKITVGVLPFVTNTGADTKDGDLALTACTVTLDNNESINAKETGGTARNMVKMNSSNEREFGGSTGHTQLIGATVKIDGPGYSGTATASTSQWAASEWGIHVETDAGTVHLVYNYGGSLKKVQLT